MQERGIPIKAIAFGISCFLLIILAFSTISINHAGYRTVVQYPSGYLFVKFKPGWYFTFFGSTETYPDVITYDFDKIEEGKGEKATISQRGIEVRYQDGGTGTVFGKARYTLPLDEPTMLDLHKALRSPEGVANKLIKAVTEEAENLTAGLMTSEDAYATKRGIFTQWSEDQIKNGKFQTVLNEFTDTDEVTGKKVTKVVPEIKYEGGKAVHLVSDLKIYGITVSGYQITDWDFEKKTLEQISTKREATMAIITAKANAERAKQDTITAEEQGKANVMKARYEKEVEKERAVVEAEQAKAVAVIAAQQKVDVAAQEKLEAEQKKLAAQQYKQEQILRGEGDAEKKRLVLQADGALEQKLATYKAVMGMFATEFGKQKWVPEVMMGASIDGKGNEAANLINLLSAQALRDMGLDMTIPKGASTK